ncbi:ATP-binding protein [Chloroflexota bacterium]
MFWKAVKVKSKRYGSNLLNWLFEPSAAVPEKRRLRIMLISVYLFFLTFSALNGTILLQASGNPEWIILRTMSVLFAIGYIISRTRYFSIALVLGIAIPALYPAFVNFVVGDQSNLFGTLIWMVMPLTIASLVLSPRSIIIVIISYFAYAILLLILADAPVDAVVPTIAFFSIIAFFLGTNAALFRRDQVNIEKESNERILAEDALRESEEFSTTLLKNAAHPILVLNPDWSVEYANPAFEKITGYSAEEMIGTKPPFPYWTQGKPETSEEPHNPEKHFKEVLERGIRVVEREFIHKSGTPFWVQVTTIPIMAGGNLRYFLSNWMDITGRKMAEKEREELLGTLRGKSAELERIIYIASHDLRSPMVNIQGFSRELEQYMKDIREIMQDDTVPSSIKDKLSVYLDEDIPDAIKFILAGTSKIDTLLMGLLRISRLGRTPLDIQKINMKEMINEVVNALEFNFVSADVKLEIGEMPDCYGDKMRVNQIFSNLVDNAVKYRDPERPAVIKVSGSAEDGQAVFCVEDNGVGVAENDQSKVFEIFQRLKPDAASGEGLGLTIVSRLVDRHAGKIWLESKVGQGSKFFVSLPSTSKLKEDERELCWQKK